MSRLRSPAVMLFLIAPIIAEVLPGATPPALFVLFPPVAIWQFCLYGGGALIIRQLARRWGGGWWTILALGAAYALIEEGLSLKVIFNTAFEGAGALATYGRVGEVSTVFTAQLLVYHSVVSITIPILLTELAFPHRRDEQWLGAGGLRVVVALWLAALVFGYAVVHPEAPPTAYLATILAVAALVGLGWWSRRLRARGSGGRTRRWPWLFVASAVSTVAFFGVSWGGPDAGRPPLLSLILQIVVVAASVTVISRLGRGRPFTDADRLALGAGVLAFFLATDLTKPAGAPLLAVATTLLLLMLARRVGRRAIATA